MQKITTENYWRAIARIGDRLIPDLRQSHDFIAEQYAKGGDSWDRILGSDDLRDMLEVYFETLGKWLASADIDPFDTGGGKQGPDNPPEGDPCPKCETGQGKRKAGGKSKGAAKAKPRTQEAKKPSGKQKSAKAAKEATGPTLVPSMSAGQALLRRLYSLVTRPCTVGKLVNMLTAIQKAATKGQLQKSGEEAEIYNILKKCEAKFVTALNTEYKGKPLDAPVTFGVGNDTMLLLEAVVKGTKQHPLVALVVRFLGMQGKPVEVEKARKLIAAIRKQTESGQWAKEGPQFTAIKSALQSLEEYVGGKRKTPKVSQQTLDGLKGILSACGCDKRRPLAGLGGDYGEGAAYIAPTFKTPAQDPYQGRQGSFATSDGGASKESAPVAPPRQSPATTRPQGYIIAPPVQQGKPNPITYASHRPPAINVPTLHFTGRWQALFNQPTKGFSALIYGQPKSGKSTMAIDFAGYLARSFGRVLYASIEEGGRSTLDERINRLSVAHPNMDISNNLPADLSKYDFIVTDSVSRGNLDLSQMQQLKEDWPDKSFIFLFHTTKDGLPRGTNQFLHEVDVLVNVKDGIATADGRFGPGHMDVRFN